MLIADVTAARNGHDGRVASPGGPRASRPKRRTFTREYKMSILEQYEAASTPQERNGLLRREGIYSAYVTEWRRERDRAAAPAAPERKPGRPAKDPAGAENSRSEALSPRFWSRRCPGRLAWPEQRASGKGTRHHGKDTWP